MRLDDENDCHPPLLPAARSVVGTVPGGRAFVLALASVVCNSLHRNCGPLHAMDCTTCRHAVECRTQMSETVLFTANMSENFKTDHS